jgi:voltage-gated potassium channel
MSLSLREAARVNGRVIYLELLVLLLSLYTLGALVAEVLVPLSADTLALLTRVDNLVCVVFLADFVVHLYRAPSRWRYLTTGWIDLFSSVPTVGWLRWGRLFRMLRILRALRSFHEVREHLRADRARGAFFAVGLLSLVAILLATIAEFQAESGAPHANIHSGGDALWWSFATITTIGYGDHYPTTVAGKFVAVVLVVFGLSFFGTFTAYVATFFLEKTQLKGESEVHQLIREVKSLREKIERLETRGPPASSPEIGSARDIS